MTTNPQTSSMSPTSSPAPSQNLPRVFLLDPATLASVKDKIAAGDHSFDQPLSKLLRDANKALRAGPFSVTEKSQVPPSGDKHDYMSLSRYWWPNPETSDGLPYVRRDGEVNPEILTYPDEKNMNLMVDSVSSLALGYYLLRDERYAAHGALLIRAWFLDDATHMNPNMKYGQVIKGVENGKEAGVLDTRRLAEVVDAIGMIADSPAWTTSDQQRMQRWFYEYLAWMQTSSIGIAESNRDNNHGTWYDTQAADYALFVGKTDLATSVLRNSLAKRIAKQIQPDGSQPQELARTKSWDYSLFNLSALFRLATLGQRAGVDLWHYETPDGRSLRKALDYLMPYATGTQKWPYKQITSLTNADLIPVLFEAVVVYQSQGYRQLADHLTVPDGAGNRLFLLWPTE